MLSDERLAEIKARCEAATHEHYDLAKRTIGFPISSTDIPDLVAEVEQRRAEIKKLSIVVLDAMIFYDGQRIEIGKLKDALHDMLEEHDGGFGGSGTRCVPCDSARAALEATAKRDEP